MLVLNSVRTVSQNWFRATIADTKTAKDAAMQAVGASLFVTAVTSLVATLSIVLKHPVLGIDAWGLVDAGYSA